VEHHKEAETDMFCRPSGQFYHFDGTARFLCPDAHGPNAAGIENKVEKQPLFRPLFQWRMKNEENAQNYVRKTFHHVQFSY